MRWRCLTPSRYFLLSDFLCFACAKHDKNNTRTTCVGCACRSVGLSSEEPGWAVHASRHHQTDIPRDLSHRNRHLPREFLVSFRPHNPRPLAHGPTMGTVSRYFWSRRPLWVELRGNFFSFPRPSSRTFFFLCSNIPTSQFFLPESTSFEFGSSFTVTLCS